MPGIPLGLIKCVIQGHISTVQDWSTAFWLGLDEGSAPTSDTMDAIAAAIQPEVETFTGVAVSEIWSSAVSYEQLKVYYYPASTTVAEYVGVAAPATIVHGTHGGTMPPLVAMVASLRTPFEGRSRRGRMYWPAMGALNSADGQYQDATCAAIATGTAAMLTAVNALDLTSEGVTGSTVVVASFTKAYTTPVTEVIVDSIPDTQHRREDKLGADYTHSGAVT
jgi:hypothetical protein